MCLSPTLIKNILWSEMIQAINVQFWVCSKSPSIARIIFFVFVKSWLDCHTFLSFTTTIVRQLSIIYAVIKYSICTDISEVFLNKFVLYKLLTTAYIMTYGNKLSYLLPTIILNLM